LPERGGQTANEKRSSVTEAREKLNELRLGYPVSSKRAQDGCESNRRSRGGEKRQRVIEKLKLQPEEDR